MATKSGDKQQLKAELMEELLKANAFWSYAHVQGSEVPAEVLIEQTFKHLDMKDISKLFMLYPHQYIRKVWRTHMAIQGDYLFDLNVMIAALYFKIKHPEQYIRRIEREHLNKIYADA